MTVNLDKDLYEQYLKILEERDYVLELLREAWDWIENPIKDQEDAVAFTAFENEIKKVI